MCYQKGIFSNKIPEGHILIQLATCVDELAKTQTMVQEVEYYM